MKTKTAVIGLTGSIGSGKSLAAEVMKRLGAAIIDADDLARQAIKPGSQIWQAVVECFGSALLLDNGEINRKRLAQIVFNDQLARQKLEALVHPEVQCLFAAELARLQAGQQPALIIAVIPLLFESKTAFPEIEKTVLIAAADQSCLERITRRDGCSEEEARKRLAAQLPTEQKRKLVDFVIENDGTVEEFEQRVSDCYQQLLKQFGSH